MSADNQVTVIEITADYLCLVVLGDKSSIENLISDMKNTCRAEDKTEYIAVKIDCPSANKCYELTKSLNNGIDIENISISDLNKIKNVKIDDGVETAQCYTYAEGYHSQLYMLMRITEDENSYILGYPKFELEDDEDPELLVEDWFRQRTKKIPGGLRKNMKLITVVGADTNILVIATKINKRNKK
jgi:hypothetical protein